MNLSWNTGLNFIRDLGKTNKQFAVIGMGQFGRGIASTLKKLDCEVLGIDSDQKIIDDVINEGILTHAVQLDCTEKSALKEAGVFEFDTVIVAVGSFVEVSLITTFNLKEEKVPFVIAKASSETHRKLLKRVGADEIVYPEYDLGCQIAKLLVKPSNILERFVIDPEHSIVEITTPDAFEGKSIIELKLREKYGLTVLAILDQDKPIINPLPNCQLHKGTHIIVLGSYKNIDKLCKS